MSSSSSSSSSSSDDELPPQQQQQQQQQVAVQKEVAVEEAPAAEVEAKSDAAAVTKQDPPKKKKKKKQALELQPLKASEVEFYKKIVHRAMKIEHKRSVNNLKKQIKKLKPIDIDGDDMFAAEVLSEPNQARLTRYQLNLAASQAMDVEELTNLAWTKNMTEEKPSLKIDETKPVQVKRKELTFHYIAKPGVKAAFAEILIKRKRKVRNILKKESIAQTKVRSKVAAQEMKVKRDAVEAAREARLMALPEEERNRKLKLKQDKLIKSVFGAVIRVGDIVDGVIEAVESYGAFIRFWHQKKQMRAMCHISELADDFIANTEEAFVVGMRVTAMVLTSDMGTKRIGLTCRPSKILELNPGADITVDQFCDEILYGEPEAPERKGAQLGESQFIGALGQDMPQENTWQEPNAVRRRKVPEAIVKFMEISARVTTGRNKQRMGQRDRRALLLKCFGDKAHAVSGKRKAPGAPTEENEAEDMVGAIMKKKRTMTGAVTTQTDNNNRSSNNNNNNNNRAPATNNNTQKKSAPVHMNPVGRNGAEMHPSWLAMQAQKEKLNAKPTGKKIKL